ncbi:uncharacterized protein LOC130902390 isoform X1 [Diorhabda carinulata]|uniref:uncharacterized protein LOC130902390 isoform X1 n=2 Tax=Diorhabda carinulata TaxID=1163345 RepID=UPI0025A2A8C6|nr:uncharacterized protein LOC130902390 isoform X1 [Diorhabda carinulata]
MNRSITLSEIVSSTFTNNVGERENYKNHKEKFVLKIAVGIIEFLVASVYQCYGIILANLIEQGIYPVEKVTWTTFIYIAAWNVSAPWSHLLVQYWDNKGCFPYKTLISASAICLAGGIMIPYHILCYGIFGGIFSNIIYTQLKYLVRKKYKSGERAFEGNIQSARAISLMIMPHIVLILIDNYTMNYVTMIYAGIILIVIPASFILKEPRQDRDISPGMGRYQTLPAFSQQMKEMKVFANSANTSDMKHGELYNNDEISDEEISDNEDDGKNQDNDDLIIQEESYNKTNNIYLPPAPLTPTTVQLYYSHAGVSILPQIPEEVDEIDETNINVIDPKRLSRISTALEELNRIEKKEIVIPKEIVIKPELIQNIEYIPNYTEKKNLFLKDMKFDKKKPCCSCSPYSIFLWKRRIRSWKDCLLDTVFVPLFRSLTDPHFYPIMISKVLLGVSSNFFISLTPYITLKKNDGYKKEDMAFLLSYIAFSWCLSLVLLPLLMKFSATKLRITFVVGLAFSTCSMLLLTKRKMSNDFITWSCLFFGFGYGLSRFAEMSVYRFFVGKRKFSRLEGILNTISGCLVILIYYLIYIYNLDLAAFFPLTTAICYFVVGVTWLVIPIIKDVIVYMNKSFRRSESGSIL